MRVIITCKNVKADDRLKDTIEKKFSKLGKYFSDDIGVNVMLSEVKNRQKMEATIKARNMIFRAEDKSGDFYSEVDNVVEKLSSQMSRFKDKIQKKHKNSKEFIFADWPEADVKETGEIIKTKKFIPAQSHYDIITTERILQTICHRNDDLISYTMSECIVECLEMIDIEQDEHTSLAVCEHG